MAKKENQREIIAQTEVKNDTQNATDLANTAKSVYAVKKGESLADIATKHKMSVRTLMQLNELNTFDVVVGMKLKV